MISPGTEPYTKASQMKKDVKAGDCTRGAGMAEQGSKLAEEEKTTSLPIQLHILAYLGLVLI